MNAPNENSARGTDPLRRSPEHAAEVDALRIERENAAQALNVSESRFKALFESNIVGIIFADTRGNITEANHAFLDLVGYTRDDLPLRWDKMTPPRWRATDEAKTADLLKTGIGAPWQKEYIARDGTHVPILVGAALLPGSDGDCVGFVQDLSDIKRAEAAIKQNEKRYRMLYEDSPLIYFALTPDNVVLSINAFGAKELGYDKDELIGRSILALLREDDRDATEKHLSAVNEKNSYARWEFRHVRKDGGVMWVHASARSVRKRGDQAEVLLICKNITRRKEAERKILEHQAQLKTLTVESFLAEEQERRRIAVGLHDEVGQNLVMARAHLGSLSNPSVEADQCLRAIRGLIDRTIETTRSLTFELSSPILYELGLEPALKSLADQMQRDHDIRFRFDTDKRPRPLSVDAGVILYRIVRELAHNVVKHAKARGGRIAIATVREEVHICVEDDGTGMDVSGDRIKPKGFGLFSIREHLDSLGGRMQIESTPGKGTRIVVAVPAEA